MVKTWSRRDRGRRGTAHPRRYRRHAPPWDRCASGTPVLYDPRAARGPDPSGAARPPLPTIRGTTERDRTGPPLRRHAHPWRRSEENPSLKTEGFILVADECDPSDQHQAVVGSRPREGTGTRCRKLPHAGRHIQIVHPLHGWTHDLPAVRACHFYRVKTIEWQPAVTGKQNIRQVQIEIARLDLTGVLHDLVARIKHPEITLVRVCVPLPVTSNAFSRNARMYRVDDRLRRTHGRREHGSGNPHPNPNPHQSHIAPPRQRAFSRWAS